MCKINNMWKVTLILTVIANLGTPILGRNEQHFDNEKVDSILSPPPRKCVFNTKTPNPLNPRTFYYCSSTGPTLIKCPETMVFEAASSACIKDNTPPSDKATTCESSGFFRSTDCAKFYRCVDFYGNGEYTIFWFDCPGGLVFDERHSACNWPDQAPPCERGNAKIGGAKSTPDGLSANGTNIIN